MYRTNPSMGTSQRMLLPVAVTVVAVSLFVPSGTSPVRRDARRADTSTAKQVTAVARALARVPLAFIENQGQWRGESLFVARQGRLTAAFSRKGVRLHLRGSAASAVDDVRLNLVFTHVEPEATLEGEQRLAQSYNFFLGDDPDQWRTGVPGYARLRYRAIEPGIDLVAHEEAKRLQYDLELAPGADLDRFVVRCEGARALSIAEDGSLVMKTRTRELRQTAPIAWQTLADGSRAPIDCRFRVINETCYGFETEARDPQLAMTVDPQIDYATYFGGNSNDHVAAIAVDSNGCIYIAGDTFSTDLAPDATHGNTTRNANKNVGFLAKLDPAASQDSLLFLSMFGGDTSVITTAMTLDPLANAAYIAGSTTASNFPTSTLNPALRANNGGRDGFLVCLDTASGATMLYGVLFGGSGNDEVKDVTVDSQNNAHVTGVKQNDATTQIGGVAARVHGPLGANDGFVVALDMTGSTVLAGALIGGSNGDSPNEITIAGGSTYLAGVTSNDPADPAGWFPTTSDALKRGPAANGGSKKKGRKSTSTTDLDGFVVRLDATLTTVEYSTLLGGSSRDVPRELVYANGRAYVTGYTQSSDYPTANPAFDSSIGLTGDVLRGSQDLFASVLDFTAFDPGVVAPSLTFSTYLGGDGQEAPGGMAVDGQGNLYVGGHSGSLRGRQKSVPLVGAQIKTSKLDARDAFLAVLRPVGNSYELAYNSLVGGNDLDNAPELALGPQDSVHLVFPTMSTDLFTTGNAAFGSEAAASWGSYVIKIRSPL